MLKEIHKKKYISFFFTFSLLLEDVEEVLNLQDAVFGQVGAVDCILHFILAEFGSYGVLFDQSADLRVVRASQLSEGLNCVLLPYFQSNAGSSGEVLSHLSELRNHSLVDLVELLRSGSVEGEALESGDFETFLED